MMPFPLSINKAHLINEPFVTPIPQQSGAKSPINVARCVVIAELMKTSSVFYPAASETASVRRDCSLSQSMRGKAQPPKG